jgi:hypothetical protein
MNATKVLSFVAVGAFLVMAAPAQQAQALALSNPGAAAAVRADAKQTTTEVHWRHYHHHWRHHRWHRHHWHRHHWHRHHWHHRHW